jgi:hypothetical protein
MTSERLSALHEGWPRRAAGPLEQTEVFRFAVHRPVQHHWRARRDEMAADGRFGAIAVRRW